MKDKEYICNDMIWYKKNHFENGADYNNNMRSGFLDLILKEQYPVTAHAPNFDFWTGCREIKRCEESKRTLKNPFASRLTGFNTTLKLLRITDQWYIVPVKFWFGQNLDFLALLLLPLAGGPKDWSHFDARLKAYFFCQLPYKLR